MIYTPFGIGRHHGSADRKRLDGRAQVEHNPPHVPLQLPALILQQALEEWPCARQRVGLLPVRSTGSTWPATPAYTNGSAPWWPPLAGNVRAEKSTDSLAGRLTGLAPEAMSPANPRRTTAARDARRRRPPRLRPPRFPVAQLPWLCRNRQRFVDEERDADQCPPAGGKSRRHS